MERKCISLGTKMPRPKKNSGIAFMPQSVACRRMTSRHLESQSAGQFGSGLPHCSDAARESNELVMDASAFST